jgi:hypothetical protein
MKRMALLVLGIVAASTSAFAQAALDNDTILLAAPANLRAEATVIKWKPDHRPTRSRRAQTRWSARPIRLPEQQPFSIECTNLGNLTAPPRNIKFEALGDKAKTQAALDAAEKDGTRVKPEFGSVWSPAGADKDHARAHMTVAVPGATTATLGLPDNGRGGGVWIMNAGTTTAHLMIPGE